MYVDRLLRIRYPYEGISVKYACFVTRQQSTLNLKIQNDCHLEA